MIVPVPRKTPSGAGPRVLDLVDTPAGQASPLRDLGIGDALRVKLLDHSAAKPCQLGHFLLGRAQSLGGLADQQVGIVDRGDPLKVTRWHGGSLSMVLHRV
ncbi:hypothetical protein GCM10020219_014590 [Nonomuraea dietziae]